MMLSRRTMLKGGTTGAMTAPGPSIRHARAASNTRIMSAVMHGDLLIRSIPVGLVPTSPPTTVR